MMHSPFPVAPRADVAASIAGDSAVLGAVERISGAMGRAWRSSRTRDTLCRIQIAAARDEHERIRLVGWVALSASVTRIVVLGFGGLVETPGAGLGWLAALPFAAVCVMRPDAVAAAWRQRRWQGRQD